MTHYTTQREYHHAREAQDKHKLALEKDRIKTYTEPENSTIRFVIRSRRRGYVCLKSGHKQSMGSKGVVFHLRTTITYTPSKYRAYQFSSLDECRNYRNRLPKSDFVIEVHEYVD